MAGPALFASGRLLFWKAAGKADAPGEEPELPPVTVLPRDFRATANA